MHEIKGWHGGKIKAFTQHPDGREVAFEHAAQVQAFNAAALPFIHEHVAIMPDVHAGYGSTVGSVIPTKGAIIPAAVGVDIGCGMMAVRTTLTGDDLPDSLEKLRSLIEHAVPHGGPGKHGSWLEPGRQGIPNAIMNAWVKTGMEARFKVLCDKHPIIEQSFHVVQLGSLGGGNHFIEVCLDKDNRVWVMLHSGSRGVGNVIGRYFTEKAKEALNKRGGYIPQDKDLAWFEEGEQLFDDYVEAVGWGQDFARLNREMMMVNVLRVMRTVLPPFKTDKEAVNCHHNYVTKEHHFGADVFVTRKGAVSAKDGELGIIPGSMGARSYIVRGKGNPDSFCSCSHGAGRTMSRTKAKAEFTVEDMVKATEGVECRKDAGVIDEIPMAYKDIDTVIDIQVASGQIEVVAILKQVLCVKG
ncbi:tRNA-splicing ligase [Brevundimonas phage vB_BpoS-Papperlapapp]|uniref:3'-phosphate/5'-hydroxy nucleic acid ligase n=1 Tax=Brevundimonas phage vB_BpoS-Domovoi TaxID=2948598 RepID=A0A9E7MRK5_9CAUD|nr:tRNA-splicing ligase [Brevundimonas phage vB_BpoS-Domovoi]USN16181.1 tRNA-splicing ligase [Brevundimonas phage vB_BpoS-Papperlapapp]